MEFHSQTEAQQAANEASRYYLTGYDPGAEPNIEEGDLFDCQFPDGKSIYRFEHTKRPRREGIYLIALSGILLRKRVHARPGNRAVLFAPGMASPEKAGDVICVDLNDPSVVFLGYEKSTLVKYAWKKHRVTSAGEEAGYGRHHSRNPFEGL